MRNSLIVSLCLVTSAAFLTGVKAGASGVSKPVTVALGDRNGDVLSSDGGSYAAPDVEAHVTDQKMQDGFSISDSATNTTRSMLLNFPSAGIHDYRCSNFWFEIQDSSFYNLPVGTGKSVDIALDFHCTSDNRTDILKNFNYRVTWLINNCVRVDRTAAKTWVFSADSSCWATVYGKSRTVLGAFFAPFVLSATEN